jgi:hypothetical protein
METRGWISGSNTECEARKIKGGGARVCCIQAQQIAFVNLILHSLVHSKPSSPRRRGKGEKNGSTPENPM